MRLAILLLVALSLEGAVTIRTVRSSGGDYPATLAGLQSAVDFCAALNDTDPCIVEIEAGVTITGAACTLWLPAQTNATKPIIIRSSRISELPENVRVTPADASKLARIESSCNPTGSMFAVVQAEPLATPPSHYILQGLNLHYTSATSNQALLGIVVIGLTATSTWFHKYSMAPHNITIDRCWLHGMDTSSWVGTSDTHAVSNGVIASGRAITIKNSTINNLNRDNETHGSAETKGIAAFNSPGGNIHANNLIDATIGSLYGGANTWIPAVVPVDLKFFGNEYTRDYWHWHWLENDTVNALDTTKPCFNNSFWQETDTPLRKWKCIGGAWASSSDNRPNRNWSKNGWECKNCRAVQVEGNYIHDIPVTGDQSQFGHAVLINLVDGFDYPMTDHVRNELIDIQFNRVARVGEVFTIGGLPSGYPVKNNRIRIQHNITEDLQPYQVSPLKGTEFDRGGGRAFRASQTSFDVSLERNTFISTRPQSYNAWTNAIDTDPIKDVRIRNNIYAWGEHGHRQLNSGPDSCPLFAVTMTGAVYWSNFALVDNQSKGQVAYDFIYTNPACPVTNQRVATWADVRFVSFAASGGDYRLCTAAGVPHASCVGASPLATAASDGGPLGADAVQVSTMTAGAAAGTYDPGMFEMQIRRADPTQIRYTSWARTGTCSGTIKTEAGVTVDSWSDGITNARERTRTPVLASNGRYIVRVTCNNAGATASIWRERELLRVQ